MAGYGRRVGQATGIHDDLAAQAIVVSDGAHKAAFVSVDVLALGIRICDAIATQVAAATDIPAEAVMVCATHTHSGPQFNIYATPRDGASRKDAPGRDLEWERALPGRITSAIVEANSSLRPAAIRAASGTFGFGTNRRLIRADGSIQLAPNYAGVADREMKVLGIYEAGSTHDAIAFLLNYPCHGVVLCEDNLLYSRDWPGFALDAIEQSAGPSAIALFVQGACGNIDPIRRGSFELAAKAGEEAARIMSGALAHETVTRSAALVSHRLPLRLRVRDLGASLAIARANVRQTELALNNHLGVGGIQKKRLTDQHQRSLDEFAALQTLEDGNRRDKRIDQAAGELVTHMTVLGLGDIAFVGVPGELFAELGLALKTNTHFRHTFVLGYCNDLAGYLPTREAYETGGYEVETSRVAQGSGEAIVHQALLCLSQIRRELDLK